MTSWFVRQVPRWPGRVLTSPPGGSAPLPPDGSEPTHELRSRPREEPSRYPVGVDEIAPQGPLRRGDTAPLPWTSFESAPVDAQRYEGRAQDIDKAGNVFVRVWEHPNGRAGTMIFARDTDFDPEAPHLGALLRIWTWREFTEAGGWKERAHVLVSNREVSDDDRRELVELARELASERPKE